MAPTTNNLIDELKLEGVGTGDNDSVILMHAHPNHIGRCLNYKNTRAFPNASYVMKNKQEWGFGMSNPDLSNTCIPEHLFLFLGLAFFVFKNASKRSKLLFH